MKVIISGIGAVFPGGTGAPALHAALREGKALFRPSRRDPEILAAECDEGLKPLIRRKGLAALSRAALLAAASIEDLLGAVPGLVPDIEAGGCGLVAGTAFGHIESKAEFHGAAVREGVRLVSPILFPNTIINSLAGHAAILFGVTGPNSTVTSGRRSGLEAILRASSLLRAGRARRMIVAGCEEVSPALLRALRAEGHACEGPGARAGGRICPGEAGVALLLEPAEDVPEGRTGLACVAGAGERSTVGCTLREAVMGAMGAALLSAGVAPRDVAWVALSAGGLEALDEPEREAVHAIFGERAATRAPKAILGETYGAAGAASSAWAALEASSGPVLVSAVDTGGASALVLGPVTGPAPGPAAPGGG